MIEIYTDASMRTTSVGTIQGGIGVYFGEGNKKNVSESIDIGLPTIQAYETEAVYKALQLADNTDDVTIFTDSMYVVECIGQYYAEYTKRWISLNKNPSVHALVIKKCKKIINKRTNLGKQTLIRHVKAHSGIPGNVAADKLAGLASSKAILPDIFQPTPVPSNQVAVDIHKSVFTQVSNIDTTLLALQDNNTECTPVLLETNVLLPSKNTTMTVSTTSAININSEIEDSVITSTEIEDSLKWDWGSSKFKKKKNLSNVPSELEFNSAVNLDAYWNHPIMSQGYIDTDTKEILSINKESEVFEDTGVEIRSNDLNISASTALLVSGKLCKLFLTCLECTQTILISYPKGHLLASFEELNITTDLVFALTKCRHCLTLHTPSRLINATAESKKYKESFTEVRLSAKMIQGCKSHIVAETICGATIEILSISGYIDFVPITSIVRLCGKGTTSQTVSVTNTKLYDYLENGFL